MKKSIKRALAIILALSMMLALTACGGSAAPASSASAAKSEPAAAAEAKSEAAPAAEAKSEAAPAAEAKSEAAPAEEAKSEPAAAAESSTAEASAETSSADEEFVLDDFVYDPNKFADVDKSDWIKMDLSYATMVPEDNPNNVCITTLQEKLNDIMPGMINITIFASSSLVATKDMLDGVINGVCDIGNIAVHYFETRLPLTQILCSPGVPSNGSGVAAKAHMDWIRECKPAEYDDFVVLMTQGSGPLALVTNGPANSLETIQGKQFGASGIVGKVLEAWGAIPVSLTDPEVYEATRNGLVSGHYGFYGGLAHNRLDETCDHVMISNLIQQEYVFGMNKARFNEMPESQQEAFMYAAEAAWHAYTLWYNDLNLASDPIVVEFASKMKHTFLDPESEDYAKMKAAAETLLDERIAALDAQGLDGTGTAEYIIGKCEEYNKDLTWDNYIKYYPNPLMDDGQ